MKEKKIILKRAIFITFLTICLIVSIIIIATKILNNERNKKILTFEGCFYEKNKLQNLRIETEYWNVNVPDDIADDDGYRSKSYLFLDNKEISDCYIDVTYEQVEIIDYNNDGIDEIKATYQAKFPSSGIWCHIYKINSDKLIELDVYKITKFIYTPEGYSVYTSLKDKIVNSLNNSSKRSN